MQLTPQRKLLMAQNRISFQMLSPTSECSSLECSGLPHGTHSEVVPKQLHDQGAVFVRLFIQRVQLCYRFIKCLKT